MNVFFNLLVGGKKQTTFVFSILTIYHLRRKTLECAPVFLSLRIRVLLVQIKPDYIRREDIMKELQEIEHNLNELEKRGVELEVKLRTCEEGERNADPSFADIEEDVRIG